MNTKELCKWLRDNSSGIYRPSEEAAIVIETLEAKNDKLKEFVKELKYLINEKCTNNCEDCDFLNYLQNVQCYECTHKIKGRWLSENGGMGCEFHTELKAVEDKLKILEDNP